MSRSNLLNHSNAHYRGQPTEVRVGDERFFSCLDVFGLKKHGNGVSSDADISIDASVDANAARHHFRNRYRFD